MKRRPFMILCANLSIISFFSGCAELTGSEGVDLEIRNTDSEKHSYEVTADDGHQSPTTSGELTSNESETTSNFLPYLDYGHSATIKVTLDETQIHETTVHIETDIEVIEIEIIDSKSVTVGPDAIYSPSPP